jgi:hypothetical protein
VATGEKSTIRTGPNRWMALIVVCLIVFVICVNTTAINTAVATIAEYVSCQVCKSPPAWFHVSYPAINRGCSVNSSFRSSFAIDPALK